MGKNLNRQDSLEHHPGCIKGMLSHFHNHTLSFARKTLPYRRSGQRKWISVDDDDGSSTPSPEKGESQEKCFSKMDDSAAAAKLSEPVLVQKKSMKKRIKAKISEEVSKRKGRHKRSSSCPVQIQKHRNSDVHNLEPLDQSNFQLNEDITSQSSPNGQEEVVTTPSTCDLCAAMSTMNYERPVEDHTLLQNKSMSRNASLEKSRIFLEALDLLNMRKELFLNVLRDPCSQLHEKRLSKSRVRLTKSMSFPCARALEAKDVNFKQESDCLTHGDSKFPSEVQNSRTYASAGESNDQSMSLAVCSDEATPEQPQRQPKPTNNLSPVPSNQLNTRQDKIVIKRFKNLGEKIRHAIKEGRKERQHIIKDAVLHKIPKGKKSKGYKGQGDTSEKPSKMYMKNNFEQKSFRRASSFAGSFEKYNRLLESDPSREAKDKESERHKLRTTVTPSPIKTIPKRLNRIYSSPDLGLYHGLQSDDPLDSTCWETSITSFWMDCASSEGYVVYGKKPYIGSNSSTENQTPMDKISECESRENYVDADEFLDKRSKCESQENIEDAGEYLGRISKCERQENFVDAGEGLDKISKCESQENIVDTGEGLKIISKCGSQENSVDAGEDLDKISKSDSRENIEDAGEGSDRISKCESRENIVAAGDCLNRILGCDSPVNIEGVDEDLDRISKSGTGENFVDSGFDYTGDLKSKNSASHIDLIADKKILGVAYDSTNQEDDTDPAKYNLPDDRLVADQLLLDPEDCLASHQHELSSAATTIYENERGSSSTWSHDTSISQVQVDKNGRLEFDYVKRVLDLSGFNRSELLGKWHSPGQPVDPEVLDEVEGLLLVQSELSMIEARSCDHVLLFDLVNEVLLDIYHKSSSYWPKPLSFRSSIHPMPIGYHVLEEVWADINCYLRWKPTSDHAYIDDGDAVAQDLAKYDGWMNLQFDSECVGLELEELLFDDLLVELLSDIRN